jgi:hypothetical protein
MALSVKIKTKPKQITRSAIKSIDDKYMGSEPIQVSNITDALNWYNYMHDNEQAKNWIIDYMKKEEYSKQDISAYRRAPKYATITTVGWLARILANGNSLSDMNLEFMKSRIATMIAAGGKDTSEDTVAKKPVVDIQARVVAKNQYLLTECEEAVDNNSQLNIYEWLQGKEATVQAATTIRDHYSKWIEDFKYVDEFATRQEKKRNEEQLKYWTQFVHDCDRYCGNKKVTKVRKPREKKTKSAVDLIKNLKYQKEYGALKIVSVNPAEMIGASQVWTYNTKYRKLTRYDASGPSGIQVKGTTLIGFDVEKSSTKSVRKPEVTIQALLSAGRVALRKFLEEIKTNDTLPNGRINSDTIILRIVK